MDAPTIKTKMKPSNYTAKTFHGVRTISAISSMVVTGILVYFCIALKNEGYRIPWTFLIVLAASILTLICLILTLSIHLCTRLSPLFNLILNVPLLILWTVGLALLGWNIYGTLAHSCTKVNWGNDDGIMICQEYKALFAFVVFGTISQIAMIVVDARARIAQTRSGRYAKMRDSTSELKLEPYQSAHAVGSTGNSIHDVPYQDTAQHYRDEPGWRPGQTMNTTASGRYADYDAGDIAGRDGRQAVRMDDYYPSHSQQQHTGYNGSYGQYQYGNGH